MLEIEQHKMLNSGKICFINPGGKPLSSSWSPNVNNLVMFFAVSV